MTETSDTNRTDASSSERGLFKIESDFNEDKQAV